MRGGDSSHGTVVPESQLTVFAVVADDQVLTFHKDTLSNLVFGVKAGIVNFDLYAARLVLDGKIFVYEQSLVTPIICWQSREQNYCQ